MHRLQLRIALSCAGVALAFAANADGVNAMPFKDGAYIGLLGTGVLQAKHSPLDTGYGGTLPIGYRNDWYAMELSGSWVKFSGTQQRGGGVNGLLFPLRNWSPNTYVLLGVSALQYKGLETTTGAKDFNTLNVQGGIGQILPLRIGTYDFGIRGEALYRYGNRERQYNDQDTDLSAPRHYHQIVFNLGLQLPLGFRHEPAPPPPAAEPEVVPAPAVAPEPVAAPTPPPLPPCKTPEAGERVSLAGCGTGDHIVLRGVNFDFNKASLTANARSILDQVSEAMAEAPTVTVEVGGHTDGKGSDAYNDKLSQRRAEAVQAYLVAHGVAAERMTAKGYGKRQPVADNGTDEGRELNRRVELKITGAAGGTDVKAQ